MALMAVMAVLLAAGLALTGWWSGATYSPWRPSHEGGEADVDEASPRTAALRYIRGVSVALVGGFWAGALVTGPAMRLIMRALAVTGGDTVQGRITEAEQVVGNITLDGTVGLYVFGGLVPGLLSGAIYVLVRHWLPRGRFGGIAFGVLHLIVAATRIDPLRPDNPDFDLVGPGWLATAMFGAAAVAHGTAVKAFADRFSTAFPPKSGALRKRLLSGAPLVVPVLLVVANIFLLIPIAFGLGMAMLVQGTRGFNAARLSPRVTMGGRIALVALAVALLPGAASDLYGIVVR